MTRGPFVPRKRCGDARGRARSLDQRNVTAKFLLGSVAALDHPLES